MTRDEQLALIREKCIAANPEIAVKCHCDYCKKHRTEKNRLGTLLRPIRLADVLLALQTFKRPIELQLGWLDDSQGMAFVADGNGNAQYYNLRKDDITLQSDECISFLADLLK